MGNIIPIESREKHTVSEVMCVKCVHRWIGVRPTEVLLKQLECPNCHAIGAVIETGQEYELLK